jgi:type II secretory pathway predicted ATPase ExeA
MNRRKLLALYNLKWDPFAQELPSEALIPTRQFEHFAWRMEQQVFQGGFAGIIGLPGTGKSVALRMLSERLGNLRDVAVGELTRPQSKVPDLYREMGDIFGVKLSASNRWGGFKTLRDKWRAHVETTLMRPTLLIDEAQEMDPDSLSELRLLQSAKFDSVSYLTVVLCGDERLTGLLAHPQLQPVASRIRVRLNLEHASRSELLDLLEGALERAGNRNLLTRELAETMVDHCGGNIRALMIMGSELLEAAAHKEAPRLDEKLYLEVFQSPQVSAEREKRAGRATKGAERRRTR